MSGLFFSIALNGSQFALERISGASDCKGRYLRRHIAVLSIDPRDGRPKVLLSNTAVVRENWDLFSGSAEKPAALILSDQTAGYYDSIQEHEHLISSFNNETGDVLNIIGPDFKERATLLMHAKNEKILDFAWVDMNTIARGLFSTTINGFKKTMMLSRACADLIDSHETVFKRAIDFLLCRIDQGPSRSCLLDPVFDCRLAFTNELPEDICNIHIYSGETIIKKIAELASLHTLSISMLSNKPSIFYVRLVHAGKLYVYFVPIAFDKIKEIVLCGGGQSDGPVLMYLPHAHEPLRWQKARLVPCAASPSPSMQDVRQPDMDVQIYNANLDIRKISLQGKNRLVTEGALLRPESKENALWKIPAFTHNGQHRFEVTNGQVQYVWKLQSLAPNNELMLIEAADDLPTLYVCREDRSVDERIKLSPCEVCPASYKSITLYSADVGIQKIKLQCKNKIRTRGASTGQGKWEIPFFDIRVPHLLEISYNSFAYTWRFDELTDGTVLSLHNIGGFLVLYANLGGSHAQFAVPLIAKTSLL